MQTRVALTLFVFFSALTVWAADAVTRLNIKEGLWEMTTTHSMTGMPAIPPDTLAKMTPEQRATMEAMMNKNGMGAPATDVRKDCVTKAKLDEQTAFSNRKDDDKQCTRSVVSSTGNKLQMNIHCQGNGHDTDGNFVIEVLSSDSVKGSMHTTTNASGHAMNMDFTFVSKYLGPACGDVK